MSKLTPQNTSHAVMAQRRDRGSEVTDDFPTPPWATRALLQKVLQPHPNLPTGPCWEPACGRGHMIGPLRSFFLSVYGSDINDYGVGISTYDFLNDVRPRPMENPWWIVTNPPFNKAEAFVHKALSIASVGVAIFARLSFLESRGRYARLFEPYPPWIVAPFTERPLLLEGRLSKEGSTATAYAWFVWNKRVRVHAPKVVWIPPCRKELELDSDYV